MQDCTISENCSQKEQFFKHWNISKECRVKSLCKNDLCINLNHLYISKVDMDFLENYLHCLENNCKIWLGKFVGQRPFYAEKDLRNLIYKKHGKLLKGHYISLSCENYKCLNVEHMYLCSKLDNIKSNRTKLNLDIVKQIRKDSCSGLSPAVLSEKYKTSKQNISLIINNLTWVDENYKPKRVK
jgi:hypothetical protein